MSKGRASSSDGQEVAESDVLLPFSEGRLDFVIKLLRDGGRIPPVHSRSLLDGLKGRKHDSLTFFQRGFWLQGHMHFEMALWISMVACEQEHLVHFRHLCCLLNGWHVASELKLGFAFVIVKVSCLDFLIK